MGQVNRNINYLTAVDGITPWERLRITRNFLGDRRMALKTAELSLEKAEATIDKNSFEWREYEIMRPLTLSNIEDCKREIAFLESLEAELQVLAEQERIPGKTDEEMYEINFAKETIQVMVLEAKAQYAAVGHLSPELMQRLLRNQAALGAVVETGILNESVLTLADKSLEKIETERLPLLPSEV